MFVRIKNQESRTKWELPNTLGNAPGRCLLLNGSDTQKSRIKVVMSSHLWLGGYKAVDAFMPSALLSIPYIFAILS